MFTWASMESRWRKVTHYQQLFVIELQWLRINSHRKATSDRRETKIVWELSPYSSWRRSRDSYMWHFKMKQVLSTSRYKVHNGQPWYWIALYQGRGGITRSRGGLKGDNQVVMLVIYIKLIYVLQSQRIKQLFSCKVLDICVQAVVILFEVDVRLWKEDI